MADAWLLFSGLQFCVYLHHRVLTVMSGCIDKCSCPDWEIWNTVRERRNFLSSVAAGAMVCSVHVYNCTE